MTPKTSHQKKKDFVDFLAPIPGNNRSGESLRYTAIYDEIKEARREEDDRLSQGVWTAPIKKADWVRVDTLCQRVLCSQSKDLQVAIWWAEAQFHLRGMEGLAEGLKLVEELTHLYWDGLYPLLEGTGDELRVSLYNWLNTKLGELVLLTPITLSLDRAIPPCTFLDLQKVRVIREEGGEASFPQENSEKISKSIQQTPSSHYEDLERSCIRALETLEKLEEELSTHLEENSPTFPFLKEKIRSVQHLVQLLFEPQAHEPPPKEEKKMTAISKLSPPSKQKGGSKEFFESRAQAYAELAKIAGYLEKVEPHSPTPYLIRRAISWGGMNLSQLISTVLKEEGDLTFLLDILNVKKENLTSEDT